MVCFAIILASWFGGVRYFKGIPAGLIAIAAGMLIAWVSTALGLGYGGMSLEKLAGSLSSFGFSFPVPALDHVFSGFQFLGVILVTAIPFGIYDLVEAMDNVESASVAGDPFPVLTFFGFMHGEQIGLAQSPAVAPELRPGLRDARRLRPARAPGVDSVPRRRGAGRDTAAGQLNRRIGGGAWPPPIRHPPSFHRFRMVGAGPVPACPGYGIPPTCVQPFRR